MAALEFETQLNDDVIHIPIEIATQLAKGTAIRVSIVPLDQSQTDFTPDEAWNAILVFLQQRLAEGNAATPYTWRREDAYEHLT